MCIYIKNTFANNIQSTMQNNKEAFENKHGQEKTQLTFQIVMCHIKWNKAGSKYLSALTNSELKYYVFWVEGVDFEI